MKFRELIGSGDKIFPFAAPFIIIGFYVYKVNPLFFQVTPISPSIKILFGILLVVGLILWLWSVYLISTKARAGKLIEEGPFHIVLHPIYISVSLLVLPFWGLIYNSWFGVYAGIIFYLGRILFAGSEEVTLAKMFGERWTRYKSKVLLPWL